MRGRNVRLPAQLDETLRRYAELRDLSPEAVIIAATEQYLQDSRRVFAAHAERSYKKAVGGTG
jgi:hypothetical protein